MIGTLSQTEAEFQAAVREYAELMGWRVHVVWNSRHSPAGWPDICLVRKGRMVVAELKSERGRLTRAQQEWLADLREVPSVEVATWRPSDWPVIEDVLR